jgi:hypothetical protein
MSAESQGGEVLVYLGYDEGCSREVARAIVEAAAPVYGIAAEIIPNDSEEDLQALYTRVYGNEPTETFDEPAEISIFRVPDMNHTIVAQARLASGGGYELLAAMLDKLEVATFSLSKDLE